MNEGFFSEVYGKSCWVPHGTPYGGGFISAKIPLKWMRTRGPQMTTSSRKKEYFTRKMKKSWEFTEQPAIFVED